MNQTEQPLKRSAFNQIHAGLWWRASEYELRDGRIRPKVGAKLSCYDPWSSQSSGGDPRKRKPAIYESLIRTVRALRSKGAAGDADLDDKSQQKLLSWCQQYGLLGILPHVTHRVEFACRWRKLELDRQDGHWKVGAGASGDKLLAVRVVYSRGPGGWHSDVARVGMDRRPWNRRTEGTLVRDPHGQPLTGRVLLHDLPGDVPCTRWNLEGVNDAWARYFPDVPEAEREIYDYPLPGTEAFWRAYAEPLDEFLIGVETLNRALTNLAAVRQKRPAADPSAAAEYLDSLVAPVSPRISGSRPYRLQWQSPSLLGSLAMMALLELVTVSARVSSCSACGTVFVAKAYQSRYCSARCRHTIQKRRQRARQKRKGPEE